MSDDARKHEQANNLAIGSAPPRSSHASSPWSSLPPPPAAVVASSLFSVSITATQKRELVDDGNADGNDVDIQTERAGRSDCQREPVVSAAHLLDDRLAAGGYAERGIPSPPTSSVARLTL